MNVIKGVHPEPLLLALYFVAIWFVDGPRSLSLSYIYILFSLPGPLSGTSSDMTEILLTQALSLIINSINQSGYSYIESTKNQSQH